MNFDDLARGGTAPDGSMKTGSHLGFSSAGLAARPKTRAADNDMHDFSIELRNNRGKQSSNVKSASNSEFDDFRQSQTEEDYMRAIESFQAALDDWSGQKEHSFIGANTPIYENMTAGNGGVGMGISSSSGNKGGQARPQRPKDKKIQSGLSAYTQNVPNIILQTYKRPSKSALHSSSRGARDSSRSNSAQLSELRAAYGAIPPSPDRVGTAGTVGTASSGNSGTSGGSGGSVGGGGGSSGKGSSRRSKSAMKTSTGGTGGDGSEGDSVKLGVGSPGSSRSKGMSGLKSAPSSRAASAGKTRPAAGARPGSSSRPGSIKGTHSSRGGATASTATGTNTGESRTPVQRSSRTAGPAGTEGAGSPAGWPSHMKPTTSSGRRSSKGNAIKSSSNDTNDSNDLVGESGSDHGAPVMGSSERRQTVRSSSATKTGTSSRSGSGAPQQVKSDRQGVASAQDRERDRERDGEKVSTPKEWESVAKNAAASVAAGRSEVGRRTSNSSQAAEDKAAVSTPERARMVRPTTESNAYSGSDVRSDSVIRSQSRGGESRQPLQFREPAAPKPSPSSAPRSRAGAVGSAPAKQQTPSGATQQPHLQSSSQNQAAPKHEGSPGASQSSEHIAAIASPPTSKGVAAGSSSSPAFIPTAEIKDEEPRYGKIGMTQSVPRVEASGRDGGDIMKFDSSDKLFIQDADGIGASLDDVDFVGITINEAHYSGQSGAPAQSIPHTQVHQYLHPPLSHPSAGKPYKSPPTKANSVGGGGSPLRVDASIAFELDDDDAYSIADDPDDNTVLTYERELDGGGGGGGMARAGKAGIAEPGAAQNKAGGPVAVRPQSRKLYLGNEKSPTATGYVRAPKSAGARYTSTRIGVEESVEGGGGIISNSSGGGNTNSTRSTSPSGPHLIGMRKMSSFSELRPWREGDHLPDLRPPSRQSSAFPVNLTEKSAKEAEAAGAGAGAESDESNIVSGTNPSSAAAGARAVSPLIVSGHISPEAVKAVSYESKLLAPVDVPVVPVSASVSAGLAMPLGAIGLSAPGTAPTPSMVSSTPGRSSQRSLSTSFMDDDDGDSVDEGQMPLDTPILRPPSRQKLAAQHLFGDGDFGASQGQGQRGGAGSSSSGGQVRGPAPMLSKADRSISWESGASGASGGSKGGLFKDAGGVISSPGRQCVFSSETAAALEPDAASQGIATGSATGLTSRGTPSRGSSRQQAAAASAGAGAGAGSTFQYNYNPRDDGFLDADMTSESAPFKIRVNYGNGSSGGGGGTGGRGRRNSEGKAHRKVSGDHTAGGNRGNGGTSDMVNPTNRSPTWEILEPDNTLLSPISRARPKSVNISAPVPNKLPHRSVGGSAQPGGVRSEGTVRSRSASDHGAAAAHRCSSSSGLLEARSGVGSLHPPLHHPLPPPHLYTHSNAPHYNGTHYPQLGGGAGGNRHTTSSPSFPTAGGSPKAAGNRPPSLFANSNSNVGPTGIPPSTAWASQQVGVGSGRSRESSPLTMLDPMAPRSGASGGSPVAVALLARNSGIGSGGGSGSNSALAGGAGGGVVGSRVRSSSASGSNSNSPGYLSAEHSDDSDVIGDDMDERSIVTEDSGGPEMSSATSMHTLALDSSLGEDFLSLFAPSADAGGGSGVGIGAGGPTSALLFRR